MMKKRAVIKLLAAPEDQERIRGLLDQLRKLGVRVSDTAGSLRKKDMVLAVLSEHFYDDEALKAQLFGQLAVGADTILPLNLGSCPIPEDIMNLLFARNIITASGRDDALLAERILSAIPEKKNHLSLILTVAAMVLLLIGGLFLWKSMQKPEEEPVIVETDPVVYPWGITAEDLEKIQSIVIVGDQFTYYTSEDLFSSSHWPDIYDLAYEGWEDDSRHWYSTEDGHEYTMTRYDDLRFLELMPNLRRLRLVLAEVDTDMLPDLSGNNNLNYVTIHDCNITDASWIAAKNVATIDITNTNIEDYSPLTQCSAMWYACIDGFGKYSGDVSGFAPPNVKDLVISNLQPGSVDLSGLSGCSRLANLTLDSLQITNLDFLEGNPNLQSLILRNMPQLEDISAVSSIPGLRELRIEGCDGVTDYTPISGCKKLTDLTIDRYNWIPMDSSFLNDLPQLNNIGLFGLNLNNMDFLGTLNQNYAMNLAFCGDIADYSGLADVTRYRWLHVNPRSTGGSFGDYSLVAPYLQDKVIDEMELYNCTNVDLSNLPQISNRLVINRGDLENLEGLNNEHLYRLELKDMQYLRTLDGIEGISKLRDNIMQLSIFGCPRLTDMEALNGADFLNLTFVGTYMLPDFSELNIYTLCLESIQDMEDLSCLDTLNRDKKYQFEFRGLDNLKDLSILRQFHGANLYVPPQVADQAQELVNAGNFSYYEVCYPQSGWSPLDEEIRLLSLEELETLPESVLARVSRVWIAGNQVIDPDRYEIWDEWTDDGCIPVLYDRKTDQRVKMEMGSITDFSMLSDLTGVWEIRLFNQPLNNLEGIQYFTNLEYFEARFCRDLTDASALFAQQSIREVSLHYTGITSIQGIQNLPRLQWLNIHDTEVSDLSPLAELDYSAALENGGFGLEINNTRIEDLSYLAAVPAFANLTIYGYPAESWMPYVEQTPVRCICAEMGSDELLKQFVMLHPELEEMHIENGFQLSDLTPLLQLENLHYMHIWADPHRAAASLDGLERRFHMDVD